ncbi:hypothetical protein [Chromatocurvus halotolerans]|nr:hypothetical protein [Chromatocurvus halotolerans]
MTVKAHALQISPPFANPVTILPSMLSASVKKLTVFTILNCPGAPLPLVCRSRPDVSSNGFHANYLATLRTDDVRAASTHDDPGEKRMQLLGLEISNAFRSLGTANCGFRIRFAGLLFISCLTAAPSKAGIMLWQDRAAFEQDMQTRNQLASWNEGFEHANLENFKTGSPREDFEQDENMTLTVSSSRFSFTDNAERYVSEGSQALKAVPGGWNRYHGHDKWDAANDQSNNPYGPLRLNFTAPINFLAMDITDLGSSDGESTLTARIWDNESPLGDLFKLLVGGTPHGDSHAGGSGVSGSCVPGNLSCNDHEEGSLRFFAMASDTPFSFVELGLIEDKTGDGQGFVLDDFVGFDNLQFGTLSQQVPATGSLWLMLAGILFFTRHLPRGGNTKVEPARAL